VAHARRCYQQLDEPLVIAFGLQFGEVVIVTGLAVGSVLGSAIVFGVGLPGLGAMAVGVGAAAALARGFRLLRKGAPGWVLGRLYRYGALRFLPPGVRPSRLLPLSVAPPAKARFLFSPIPGDDHGDRRARREYFAR
jgi:hypothetical protein